MSKNMEHMVREAQQAAGISDKIGRYFGDDNETLVGHMLLWGFSNNELDEAEKQGLIEYMHPDESVVYYINRMKTPR